MNEYWGDSTRNGQCESSNVQDPIYACKVPRGCERLEYNAVIIAPTPQGAQFTKENEMKVPTRNVGRRSISAYGRRCRRAVQPARRVCQSENTDG